MAIDQWQMILDLRAENKRYRGALEWIAREDYKVVPSHWEAIAKEQSTVARVALSRQDSEAALKSNASEHDSDACANCETVRKYYGEKACKHCEPAQPSSDEYQRCRECWVIESNGGAYRCAAHSIGPGIWRCTKCGLEQKLNYPKCYCGRQYAMKLSSKENGGDRG